MIDASCPFSRSRRAWARAMRRIRAVSVRVGWCSPSTTSAISLPKREAAARHGDPASVAATTRSRRSTDSAFDMPVGFLPNRKIRSAPRRGSAFAIQSGRRLLQRHTRQRIVPALFLREAFRPVWPRMPTPDSARPTPGGLACRRDEKGVLTSRLACIGDPSRRRGSRAIPCDQCEPAVRRPAAACRAPMAGRNRYHNLASTARVAGMPSGGRDGPVRPWEGFSQHTP